MKTKPLPHPFTDYEMLSMALRSFCYKYGSKITGFTVAEWPNYNWRIEVYFDEIGYGFNDPYNLRLNDEINKDVKLFTDYFEEFTNKYLENILGVTLLKLKDADWQIGFNMSQSILKCRQNVA